MQLIRSVGRELRFDDNHSGRRIEPWRDLFDRRYDRRTIVSIGALTFAPTVASVASSGDTSQRNRMALAETIRTIGAHSSPLRSSSTRARAARCYSRRNHEIQGRREHPSVRSFLPGAGPRQARGGAARRDQKDATRAVADYAITSTGTNVDSPELSHYCHIHSGQFVFLYYPARTWRQEGMARRGSTISRTASGAPGRIFGSDASARNVSDSSP